MKVGMTLPQFRDDPEPALAVALDAEAAGLDGVFVFDHLWSIAQPARPALHWQALLGALAGSTERIALGTLVARVGLVPDPVLVNALGSVHRMIGDRLIAGIGAGDRLSQAENEAYGVPFPPAAERLAAVGRVADGLRERGITTWVGGRSPGARDTAIAHADALNLWDAPVEEVAAERAVAVTWGGLVHPEDDLAVLLAGLAGAGAEWAVLAPVGFQWHEAVTVIGSLSAGVRQ
ncbi:MAG TPA: LLM class flavin-dependent oxidoreductase [Acidimicrobiales bacterium]|jgi:alkanesulfonate monooxygenase SsuD/methylene tetrahydromethanopterin reductase-like flavin-dependent oxidoreductase (luciferase family)|nr:LLM class flavin-dependent oxidoreductase [Acidimicrobiales bacterium]